MTIFRRFPHLTGWALAAIGFGALDVLLTRFRYAWRPFDSGLIWQTPLLWALLGLLALPFGVLVSKLLARGKSEPLPVWGRALVAAVVTGAPVVGHVILRRHVGIDGELSGLRSAGPWLELGGLALLVVLGGVLMSRAGRRLPWRGVAAAIVIASCLLVFIRPSSSEFVARVSTQARRPNVLLLVWDTCRSDRLQPYNYDRETTPHLASLAAESVVFEEARSVCAFTFTSHLSLLTGVYPTTHGGRLMNSVVDPRRALSVAQLFGDEGYRTGAFVGTSVLTGKTGMRIGFDHYDDQIDPSVASTAAWELVNDIQVVIAKTWPSTRNNGNPHWFQNFQRPADQVLERALDWIEADSERPWFVMVNLYDIHWPYLPQGDGQKLVRDYDGPLDGYFKRSNSYPKGYKPNGDDARYLTDLYEGELFDLDRKVDAFLSQLNLASGDTAVLMTSDHGEAFGEGGQWKHENILEPQVRVPFLVRPAAPEPKPGRVAGLVSGVDVAPTLLGLAGLEVPANMEGLNLTASVPDPERSIRVEDRDHPDPLDVRIAKYQGFWKYVELGVEDKVSKLFDLRSDSVGLLDVSAQYPEVAQMFREQLALDLEGQNLTLNPNAAGNLDAAALRALGYMGDE